MGWWNLLPSQLLASEWIHLVDPLPAQPCLFDNRQELGSNPEPPVMKQRVNHSSTISASLPTIFFRDVRVHANLSFRDKTMSSIIRTKTFATDLFLFWRSEASMRNLELFEPKTGTLSHKREQLCCDFRTTKHNGQMALFPADNQLALIDHFWRLAAGKNKLVRWTRRCLKRGKY